MKVLAVESSTAVAGCAIYYNGEIVCENWLNSGLTHSRTLMVLIEDSFKLSEVNINEIEMVCVSCGPGSFTGLRIGVSAAKGIAKALNVPCVGVSSLLGLAYNLNGFNVLACSVINARGGYIYNALFEMGNGFSFKRLCEDRVLELDELINELKNLKTTLPIYLVGDAFKETYLKAKDLGLQLNVAPLQLRLQKASSVGICGIEKFKRGEEILKDGPNLNYLRLCQAQRQRMEKLKKEGFKDGSSWK